MAVAVPDTGGATATAVVPPTSPYVPTMRVSVRDGDLSGGEGQVQPVTNGRRVHIETG